MRLNSQPISPSFPIPQEPLVANVIAEQCEGDACGGVVLRPPGGGGGGPTPSPGCVSSDGPRVVVVFIHLRILRIRVTYPS